MDPRTTAPLDRFKAVRKGLNHSRLMQLKAATPAGETVNVCPFGCEDHELDDRGYCGHLVGFYRGGKTYEPRKMVPLFKGSPTKIEIVDGSKPELMKDGFQLVRITTTARVYSPAVNKQFVVRQSQQDGEASAILEAERRLAEAAERVRTPVLEGVWGDMGDVDYAALVPDLPK